MSVLQINVTSGKPAQDLVSNFQAASDKKTMVIKVAQYLQSVGAGGQSAASSTQPPSVNIQVQDSMVKASGTFTLDTVIATDAVSINGVTFTAVASGATGNQFNVGADDDETAANLAAAINASETALVDGYVTASSSGAVVTVTSAFYGLAGNQTAIASADATITASGSYLEGGANDASALTLNF